MRTLLILLTLAVAIAAAPAARADFQAAAGKVEITPTGPAFLAGYAKNRKCEGVHDPVWARCLVMRNGGETIALVSCDLIGLFRSDIQQMRALVKSVPADHVIIGVTHTHSGPDSQGLWGPNDHTSGVDSVWMADTRRKVAALVDETAARLVPARIKLGSIGGIEKCSRNARIPEVLDTELGAMQLLDAQGKTIATLVNYACHPETLNNHQMTSDFPNWLRTRVEGALGGVAIYMNGAQGGMVTADIQNESSYPKGEAWPEAERIGNTLGDKAIEALKDGTVVEDPALTLQRREFRVPLKNTGFKMLVGAHVLPGDLMQDGDIVTEVTRFTVGPAEFLTIPGEALPSIGLYLKRNMTGHPKFLLGLTGDALGYILTPEDYGLKLYRYETSMSVGPEMGRRMEENLLALLAAAKSGEARGAAGR